MSISINYKDKKKINKNFTPLANQSLMISLALESTDRVANPAKHLLHTSGMCDGVLTRGVCTRVSASTSRPPAPLISTLQMSEMTRSFNSLDQRGRLML